MEKDYIEIHGQRESLVKRKKVFSTLNLQEVSAMKASENADQLAKDFDKIFVKLLRLIRYSTNKNNAKKTELEQHTNNLIKKFVKYLENKALNEKILWEQKAFFEDVCAFVNFFVEDTYLSTVYNSFPETELEEYSEKTMWNQLFQNMYVRNRWMNWIAQWWSCSYWTILLYNFFNELKKAWLDLEISLFRYKNLDDDILWLLNAQRHSWLIVRFQGKDYMVDHDWILYDKNKSIVRPLDPYINMPKQYKEFFENFRTENMNETDKLKFFDNVQDFIRHCEEYPEYPKLSFYAKLPGEDGMRKFAYEFWKYNFWVLIDGSMCEFFLKDNNLNPNKLLDDLVKKAFVKKVGNNFVWLMDKDRQNLKDYLNFIKWKINIKSLYKNYTCGSKWELGSVGFDGKTKIFVIKK